MTNQFLPFGSAGGANVLSNAAYQALAARLAGFSAGTARSVELNSVWRQSASIAAMIGQFITNRSGADAMDDGNITNLLALFERALQFYLSAANVDIPVDGWQSSPPGSPAIGDRYIVAASPTGAWTGQANNIAMWTGTAWMFAVPSAGLQVQFAISNKLVTLLYDGSSWDESRLVRGAYYGSGGVGTVGGTSLIIALTTSAPYVPWTASKLIGVPIRFVVAATNSGPLTLQVDGTAGPLKSGVATDLVRGDLLTGTMVEAVFDGSSYRITSAIAPTSARALRDATFRTSKSIISATGAFSFTVPAGIYLVRAKAWGAGGGGGFGAGPDPGGAGSGGGAGAYAEKTYDVQPGQTITGFVGAGGSGAPNGSVNGAAGGNTTVLVAGSSTVTCNGGYGGQTVGVGVGGISTGSSVATNGDINQAGPTGLFGIIASTAYAGAGGSAFQGGAGGSAGAGSSNGGQAPGGGGSGSANGVTGGGNGGSGQVAFEW